MEKLINKVYLLRKDLKKALDKLGIVGKARSKILLGKKVEKCPHCQTYNSYHLYTDEELGFEHFDCAKCGKTHVINLNKKNP